MHFLNKLNVGLRLGAGFAVVLLLMIITIVVSLGQMHRQQSSLEEISGESMQRISLINLMRDSVRFQAIALRDVVAQEDISFKKGELKLMREARKRYKEAGESLAGRLSDAGALHRIEQIRKLEESVAEAVSQVMEASLTDEHATARNGVRDNVRPRQMELIAALEGLQQDIEAQGTASVEAARQSYQTTRNLLLALSFAAVLLGAAVAWLITRSILAPLGESVQLASRIAAGDLTARIAVDGSDELAQLQRSLDDMVVHLAGLIREVSQAADATNIATTTLSGAANEGVKLANDTSTQLHDVGTAMGQMSDSIERVSSSARSVADSAGQTQQVARHGNDNVLQGEQAFSGVVSSMSAYATTIDSLNGRIQEISAITSVIREIADQTNLLALNAAIEAARAGESGRGFAVVADEVRKLAERTASSTESIAQKVQGISELAGKVVSAIHGINTSIDRSAALGKNTSTILGEILTAADSVVREASQINTAAMEQHAARQSTDSAVQRITSLADREAEAMREIDRVVNQLRDNSTRLQSSIARFRV